MRAIVSLMISAAVLASCGKQEPREPSEDSRTFDAREGAGAPPPAVRMQESAADAEVSQLQPSVGVTAAPGVAFNYRYAFRLPNTAIGKVQEQHAQMCEKLGLDRCRITGMRYRLIDEDNVSASLQLKLDPTLARQFGKDAVARVGEAEGMLVDSEISGVDAGSQIKTATKSIARNRDALAQLERQLADARTATDRESIREQIAELQRQINATSDTRADSEESLATTPMTLDYGSGRSVPGFDDRSPLRDAFRQAGAAFENILAGVIIVLGAILPFALIVGLALWLWRRFRPAGWKKAQADTPGA